MCYTPNDSKHFSSLSTASVKAQFSLHNNDYFILAMYVQNTEVVPSCKAPEDYSETPNLDC